MDGIGTQEAIIDTTHGVVDFLSGCDTTPLAELNAWYHMMNCGFRIALVGETDYPCITGERMGVGRSYVRLDRRPMGDTGYEAWVRGIEKGQLYCGDGRSHFLDFTVNGGRSGAGDLAIKGEGTLEIEALVAARLELQPPANLDAIKHPPVNGWHLENARIGSTRTVSVELIVNGIPVDKVALVADGEPRKIKFKAQVERSSWVALRILPSSHTHPVFLMVSGKPIRASKRSADAAKSNQAGPISSLRIIINGCEAHGPRAMSGDTAPAFLCCNSDDSPELDPKPLCGSVASARHGSNLVFGSA